MERPLPAAPRADGDGHADSVVAVLPDEVINQIAAGEVVERPASVVKELMDNALDAGAATITVECDGGGKARIRVTDDGRGMSPADARLCFSRHATSKIRSVDDLHDLATMGFRGEALSSIASVARVTLTTRRAADLAATRVVVEHGRVTSVSEVGAAVGTTIDVVELFGNVPARLKFLKGEPTESSHITDAVSRMAMAHPALHVRLRHNGRAVLDVPPDRDGLARAVALVGARMGQRLHRAVGQEGGLSVEVFLAAPELAQTTARGVQLFVGRRAVRDRSLLHAVAMGYGELVPRGRYPVAIIHVEAPAGFVDFNVHPQKSEVRFADSSAVAAAVRHTVRAGVSGAPWLHEPAHAATAHMTVRTQAPSLWREQAARQGGGELASALAHRYASQLAPASAQLRFDRAGERAGDRAGEAAQPPPSPDLFDAPASSSSVDDAASASSSSTALREAVSRALPDSARAADPSQRAPEGISRWQSAVRAVESRSAVSPSSRSIPPAPDASEPSPSEPIPDALRDAVLGALLAPSFDPPRDAPAPAPAPVPARGAVIARESPSPFGASPSPSPSPRGSADGFFSSLRFLGQLQLTYLVCEAAGELVLIDQHAAHERVEFQRLMERRESRQSVATQRLLFPSTIEVSPAHVALAEEVADLFAQLGYEIEPFGKTAIAIKSVPSGMRGADPTDVLRELLDEWLEAGASRAVESRLENMLATIACHCAVRAGDRLSFNEVEALLRSMDQVDFRAHCPHGRPVLLRLSIDEIARRFGR